VKELAPTAEELERESAAADPELPPARVPAGEAIAMLVRRGFQPSVAPLDLPFDPARADDRLLDALGRYAFRLYLRGAIRRPDGFAATEPSRFLSPAMAEETAVLLCTLGLGERLDDGRYRLIHPAHSFGGTLEWYVAAELGRRLCCDVAVGVKFHAPGVGGDLDVIAAAEGRLIAIELKSSPPKHLGPAELDAMVQRLRALRPDIAVFAMDTALRLGDKVVPMLNEAVARAGGEPAARRVEREVWALSPHVYAVNAKPNLIANLCRAIAEGLRALSPRPL
jgi:hypothetical protein